MGSGLAGFIVGAILTLATLFVVQRLLVAPVADQLSYHFSTSVFGQASFPGGGLDNGRLIRRALLPVKITTRFYDGQYREVRQADQPGRYGAVVRIDIGGSPPVYRFATLFHTAEPIFWVNVAFPISTPLPAELHLDPAVVRNQEHEIGEVVKTSFIDPDGNVSSALAILLAGLSETAPNDPPAVERTNAVARDAAWWYGLRERIGLAEKYPYLIDLPREYSAEPGKRWPLILFLDNGAHRGNNLHWVRQSGLAGVIDRGKQLPAIVVSPQCPAGEPWNNQVLAGLLDEISANYRVDPDRVSITGISLGGDAAWSFALAYPGRLAAIVPIAGAGDPADAARLKSLPIWAFHGVKDDVVPVSQTIEMVEAVRQAGGHPQMTLFPDAAHDAWDQAYADDALYTWLLAQKRNSGEGQ
jgi:acetyl esterase/lipase